MRIRVSDKDLSQQKADLAVCFAFEGDKQPRGVANSGLRRELGAQMKAESFKGKPGDELVWNADGRYPSHRFLVLGLGEQTKCVDEAVRLGCARAARAAGEFSARTLALKLPQTSARMAPAEVRAGAEGALMGAYRFDRYLTDPARQGVKLSSIEISLGGPAAALKKAVSLGAIGARAVCLARDLVNEPPSRLTPSALAREASRAAREAGLRCRVFKKTELAKLGMHALLAVARGSAEPAHVVHMVYKPTGKPRGKILLVGKGVTFDSGGLNLKSGDSMLTMKMDMGGAGCVLATMTALARVGCRAEVHALLGLVENMTGAEAYKPGDILDTYSGKTVEVGNTDAEGRLVMSDLLSYGAAKIKPTQIVDVATLTGACVVALGLRATGLFTRHDALRDSLLGAAESAGEKFWPLPMYDEYLLLMQKGPADLRNIAGRWGGAITAALFLGEFVPREIPWAHLDIAGPAFTETDLPDAPAGATGAGVLALIRWLEST